MLLLLALACGAPADTDTCVTLDVETCATRARCAVVNGRPLDWPDTAACYDLGDAEPQGCQDADLSCPPNIAYGQAPDGDGTCHEFAAGCLPEGWVACDADPAAVGECA